MTASTKQDKKARRLTARPTGKKVDAKALSREISEKFPKTIAKLAQ